jgi:ammonia channel protein AmtB
MRIKLRGANLVFVLLAWVLLSVAWWTTFVLDAGRFDSYTLYVCIVDTMIAASLAALLVYQKRKGR